VPVNEFGQPVGETLDWAARRALGPVTLTGRTCRLEPVGEQHRDGLYAALCVDSPPSTWTYMTQGPFAGREPFAAYLAALGAQPGTVPLALSLPDGTPVGIACYLRIDHDNGTAEVGSITYAPAVQRTVAATEAMYLMARHAFDVVGVRRYEWKCDSLNEPSRRAAARLGFTYEGTFRQALVYKGRNRDTAWFAITDRDWPRIRAALERWLDPGNFDEHGQQRTALATQTAQMTRTSRTTQTTLRRPTRTE
jgi:RimJ/RimL family protein N-acetyltransferase